MSQAAFQALGIKWWARKYSVLAFIEFNDMWMKQTRSEQTHWKFDCENNNWLLWEQITKESEFQKSGRTQLKSVNWSKSWKMLAINWIEIGVREEN